MPLIVETGAGLSNAESYAAVSDVAAYAAKMGAAWTSDPAAAEAALRRATLWLDTTYRLRFPGQRRYGRAQALEWPRIGAYVRTPTVGAYGWGTGGYVDVPLPNDAVPSEVVKATIEAAIREAASPNSLMPDASRDGALKRTRVGDVETEFFPGASARGGSSDFPSIDAILTSLLGSVSGYTARASRA